MKYFLRPYQGNTKRNGKKRGRAVVAGALLILGMAGGGWAVSAEAQGAQIAQMIDNSKLFLLHSHAQGYMGVYVGDVDQERVAALHLRDTHGAEITVLDHDAPAAKVGLKLHDVVLQMNGVAIQDAEQMKKMLHDIPVGKKVQLVVSRDGVLQNVTVQMADRYKMQEEARQQLDTAGNSSAPGLGFLTGSGDVPSSGGFHLWMGSSLHVGALVEPLAPQTADFLGLSGGVMIKSVARKSAADAAGLKAHDVVLEIGGEGVVTSSDWERLLRASEGKPVQVTILRDRTKQLVLLQVTGKHVKN